MDNQTDNQTEAVQQIEAGQEEAVPQEPLEEKDERPTAEEFEKIRGVAEKQILYNRKMKTKLHHEKLVTVNAIFIGKPGVGKSTMINRCATAMDQDNMYDGDEDEEDFSIRAYAPMASGDQHCTQGIVTYGEEHYYGSELGCNFTIADNKGMDQDLDKNTEQGQQNIKRLENFYKSLTDGYVIDNETLKIALTHDSEREQDRWAQKQSREGHRLSEELRPHILVFVATASNDLDDQWDLLKVFKQWRNHQHAPFVPYVVALSGADKVDESLRETPCMYRKSQDLKDFKKELQADHGVDGRLVFPIVNDVIFEEAEVSPTDPRLVALDNMTLRFLRSTHEKGTQHRRCLMKDRLKREQSYASSTVARSAWGDEHDDGLPPFPNAPKEQFQVGDRVAVTTAFETQADSIPLQVGWMGIIDSAKRGSFMVRFDGQFQSYTITTGESRNFRKGRRMPVPLQDGRERRFPDLHDRRPGAQRASSPPRTEGGRKETRSSAMPRLKGPDAKADPLKTHTEDESRDYIAEQS